ncbi:GrpB family protein [Paenibacillus xylanexedens]|uniref:GrpB family protein n=1 Tax=Paenibacillus xylanexedens TaxID=528191 RepID=UPI0011A71A44|nr:GrpB family protein [Paenibacillus xylanexedens]
MEEVNISEYNPDWNIEFEEEKNKILHALSSLEVVIEHIGSTSVSGLGAKPTIDIMAGLPSLGLMDEFYIKSLGDIGYEYVHKPEFPERLFFRRGLWRAGTHHLHIYKFRGQNWNENVLFREYLKRYPEILNEYYNLKKRLEEQFKYDRVAYTMGKADFIQEVINKASNDEELMRLLQERGSL